MRFQEELSGWNKGSYDLLRLVCSPETVLHPSPWEQTFTQKHLLLRIFPFMLVTGETWQSCANRTHTPFSPEIYTLGCIFSYSPNLFNHMSRISSIYVPFWKRQKNRNGGEVSNCQDWGVRGGDSRGAA